MPWGEEIGSQLPLDENLKSIEGDIHPGKALLFSDSPHSGLPPLSKQLMPIEAVESSADHQPSAVDPEDNQYKVEELVRKRRIRGKVQYLVKWLGYSDIENTWEAKRDIDPDLVAAFETSS
jgi:Chromo (CHRromatin Organisation MOdifier) domain